MPLSTDRPDMAAPLTRVYPAETYRASAVADRHYLPPTARYNHPDRRYDPPRHDIPTLPRPRTLADEVTQYPTWPSESPHIQKRKLGEDFDYRKHPAVYRDPVSESIVHGELGSAYFAPQTFGPSDAGPSDVSRRMSVFPSHGERIELSRPRSNSVRSNLSLTQTGRAPHDYADWHRQRMELSPPLHMQRTMLPPMEAAAALPRRRDMDHMQQRPVYHDASTVNSAFTSQAPLLPPQHLQPPRKRLRISRACDECRRRKTRCDVVGAFPGEPNHPLTMRGAVPHLGPNEEPKGDMLILQPCLNCRRSEISCSYTKRPLKRGPSKGYIKDLERRLNTLESHIVSEEQVNGHLTEETDELDETPATKPKVRTDERISRLENILSFTPREAPHEVHEEPKHDAAASKRAVKDEQSQQDATNACILPSPNIGNSKSLVSGKTVPKRLEHAAIGIKSKVLKSSLHGTFPVLPFRDTDSDIAQLEDRVLARGMRLLLDPVDKVDVCDTRDGQADIAESRSSTPGKGKSHGAKVASLIGQASAGLGTTRDELAQQSRPGAERLRAMRKIAHQLSGQEADLLMLCHLDQLRNGLDNNSALAAAVSKLGSGTCRSQDDQDTLRRRTLLFMLDRWHAVGFGTPHLLSGRFGMESRTFSSMKHALGDVSDSPLGDAVYEVLRAAVIFGQLGDLAQNGGGWKHISLSDVEAVIHSAMDNNESDSLSADEGNLLDSTALRYSLESTAKCYHALHTLPIAKEAKLEDVRRVFTLAEHIVVLGSVKTPISLQGKLLQSAIGPHVLSVAGVAFSWCLRIICRLVSQNTDLGAASSRDADGVESPCMAMEHFRRKILDYVRMCGPFCLFSGGAPTEAGSFKGVYLRLALFFNQVVGLATQMGVLVTTLPDASPARSDAASLATEADSLVELALEVGPLGYVLSSASPREAWGLLA